jgi:membrane fusion protein, multidrug efflux system
MLLSRFHNIALCSLALATLAACGPSNDGKPGAGAGGPPPAEVNVMTVAAGPVDLTTDLSGRLQSVRTAQVRARVEGVVDRILFKEGADIKAGAPLFQIDPRAYRASADAARADAQAAEQLLQRYQALLEVRGVSQQEYEAAVTRAKQAKATLAKASIDYENAMVTAPISGRVGHALVTEGTLVGRGDATPLVSIDQMDPIYVNFSQSETELFGLRQSIKQGKVKAGDNLKVQLLLADGSVYGQTGKLLVSEQTVDVNTGNVFLRAEFANPQRELMPGSFVRVRISQARMEQAIAVPQRAVQMNSNGAFVLSVTPENKVAPVPIQIGPMSGDKWVVTGGLTEGTRIVVDGVQKAKPGATVKPVDPANPAAPAASASSVASAPMAAPVASAVSAAPVAGPASAAASTASQAGR